MFHSLSHIQVSIASDKLSSIQQPTLLLQLTLGHNDGDKKDEIVTLEIPQKDLSSFFASLGAANEVVQSLRL